MELSADQLQTLASTATDPGSLEHTLLTKFPDATISVVRGLDRFAMETYTHGAYFSEAVAREVMVAIPPNTLETTLSRPKLKNAASPNVPTFLPRYVAPKL